jgi:hypothetical protein
MKERKFKRSWDASQKMISLMLIGNLILIVAVLVLSSSVATRHERIVLVPAYMDERATVEWDSATPTYYKAWAMSVSMLIGNLTPENSEFVIESLSGIFHPKIYQSVKQRLLSLAKEPMFVSGTSISYFTTDQIIYEPGTNKVFVIGEYVSTTTTASGLLNNTKNVVMEYEFKMESGLPKIVYFTSYPGRAAHTLKWKKVNRKDGETITTAEEEMKEIINAEENEDAKQ